MPLLGNIYRDGFYTLGCCTNLAAKKVREDDTLNGAHSFVALLSPFVAFVFVCGAFVPILTNFLGTLTEMGSIHCTMGSLLL